MDSRKVVKIKDSYYINIPSDVAQALGIVKGDKLWITPLIGLGLLITQAQGVGKVSMNPEGMDRLKKVADTIYWQLEGKLKNLGSNFISNLQARIISDMVRSGIFNLKARVEKVEKRVEESNRGKGRLTLVRKGRGNDH